MGSAPDALQEQGLDSFTQVVPRNVVAVAPPHASAAERVKTKLTSYLFDQVTREVDIPLGSVPVGPAREDHSNGTPALLGLPDAPDDAVGLHAYAQWIPPSDDLIGKDPQRSAYEGQSPSKHVWLRTGGLMDANIGLTTAFGAGPGFVQVGFNASGALEYSVLAPHETNLSGVGDVPKTMTLKLPVTAAHAEEMARGEEFSVRGEGCVGSSVGAGVGYKFGVGPLDGGATAGVASVASMHGEITVNVKKLDADRVFVKIDKTADHSTSFTEGVNAGMTLSEGAQNAIQGHSQNPVTDLIRNKASDLIKGKLQDNLVLQASVSQTHSRGTDHAQAFVLDLKDPAARSAYESLLKLDVGPASVLAAQGSAKRVNYTGATQSADQHAELHVGPAKLLLMDALRVDRSGHLTSSEGTQLDFDQSKFSKSRQLFGTHRSIEWEGMNLRKAGEAAQTYFHLTVDQHREVTREGDVAQFNRLTDAVGAKFDTEKQAVSDGDRLHNLLFGGFGKSDEKLDLYFTRDGLQKLQTVTTEQVETAFAEAARQIDGHAQPAAWSRPSTRAASLAMIEEYRSLDGSSTQDNDRRLRLTSSYQDNFHTDLRSDMADFARVQALNQEISAMKGQPEASWAKAFANLGQTAGYDFMKHIATLSKLAGPDQTLVHEASLESAGDPGASRLNITARDAGMVSGVDELVGQTLSPP